MPAPVAPLVTVLVAWANSPLDDPGLISGMVTSGVVTAGKWTVMTRCGPNRSLVAQLPKASRGRQHELQVFEAATCDFRFDNSDGRFNPWNTSSPYVGWLKPMRPVQVRAQWNLIAKAHSDFQLGLTWAGCGFNTTSPIEGTGSGEFPFTAAGGTASSIIQQGASTPTAQFAVDPRRSYSASVRARCTTTGVRLAIGFLWYTAAGAAAVPSFTGGAEVALPTSGDVTVTAADIVAPVGACFAEAALYHLVTAAAPVGAQATTFDCVGAWPTGTPPAWQAGARTPARFTGHLHSFPIRWPDRRASWVDAQASDLLRVLNTTELPATAYDLEVAADTPTHLWPLSESPGSTSAADLGSSSPSPGLYGPDARLGGAALVAGSQATTMGLPLVYSPPGTEKSALTLAPTVLPATADFTIEATVGGCDAVASRSLYSFFVGDVFDAPGFNVEHSTGLSLLTVTNDTSGFYSVAGPPIGDGLPHHVAVTRSGNLWALIIDGAYSTMTVAGTTTIQGGLSVGLIQSSAPPAASMGNVAVYASVLSAARIIAHRAACAGTAWAGDTANVRAGRILDTVGIAAAARNLDGTCTSQIQPAAALGGTALAYLQTLERAESGALYVDRDGDVTLVSRKSIFGRPYADPVVTFGDMAGQVAFQPDPDLSDGSDDIVNVVTASKAGGLSVRVIDAASRTAYGPRSRDLTGLPILQDSEVLDRANFELSTYAQPAFVVRALTLWPREAPAQIEAILDLDLLQLAAVARSDIPGSPLNQTTLVEGVDETWTATDWTASVALSPFQAQQYWVLGTSQLGVNTRLAF